MAADLCHNTGLLHTVLMQVQILCTLSFFHALRFRRDYVSPGFEVLSEDWF
jgi:hypothetical protein